MSKAYSTKALPPGTVLREWRLEEVLGVGGFGIVYKGRGIYFDELVAIKEYFPSSISERDEDDTVVPVDSNAEEVHALGLKKFVEEAKLLWNLSTPSRHPNIVSVRSLFEIHGTAYMVMDFEDGTPLSRLLKQGTKFNQSALSRMMLPIAQGLERAHRVGVLHRDIKPPNIMVGDDDRAVLIDFGSARFESGDATSTKVTFHTPPYAPIEQYVRTYEQGPWTDIYALGVVLYECVTGEKPPEVLERLHGGLGKTLSDGNYPGFSRAFLKAIDTAMTIRPDERPRSIAHWLSMFDAEDIGTVAEPPIEEDEEDDDATKIAYFDKSSDKIVPVAPVAKGFGDGEVVSTGVPDAPEDAKFVKAEAPVPTPAPKPTAKAPEVASTPAKPEVPSSELLSRKPEPETTTSDADKAAGASAAVAAATPNPTALKPTDTAKPVDKSKPVPAKKADAGKDDAKESLAKPAMAIVAVLAILGVAGFVMFSGGSKDTGPTPSSPIAIASAPADASQYPEMFAALLEEATNAGLGADATKALVLEDGDVKTEDDAIARLRAFGVAALAAGDAKAGAVARDLPWANTSKANSASKEIPQRRKVADNLKASLAEIKVKAGAVEEAEGIANTLLAVREEMAAFSTFRTLAASAYRVKGAQTEAALATTAAATAAASTAAATPSSPAVRDTPTASASAVDTAGVSGSTKREFERTIGDARDVARQVDRLVGKKPGSGASDVEKENYRIREASAQSAKQYKGYLDTLEASMRGTTSDAEARNSVVKASQTKAYLQALLNRSKAAK
ncbi:serine/threonine protein kinase [Croceicoccus ponticola]|uniref:Serine/threonine protein kinase n=1 Tax=Croceicoccus ponticola TaxID=2217664 RepID=A0A437GX29_9SPHN|nr:serine/threonine-protein kinase [Croceicoccus ponticola]RVQ66952.1 serine/threonine protein kinase [Croceicoccus ponticola]